jgi:hypothetical protein
MGSNVGPGRDVLHRHEALERSVRVHDASYDLRIELGDGRDTHAGHAVIEFGLDPKTEPLFLDFTGGPAYCA